MYPPGGCGSLNEMRKSQVDKTVTEPGKSIFDMALNSGYRVVDTFPCDHTSDGGNFCRMCSPLSYRLKTGTADGDDGDEDAKETKCMFCLKQLEPDMRDKTFRAECDEATSPSKMLKDVTDVVAGGRLCKSCLDKTEGKTLCLCCHVPLQDDGICMTDSAFPTKYWGVFEDACNDTEAWRPADHTNEFESNEPIDIEDFLGPDDEEEEDEEEEEEDEDEEEDDEGDEEDDDEDDEGDEEDDDEEDDKKDDKKDDENPSPLKRVRV